MARCPICKNRVEARGRNPYAPFGSERCKMIDLDHWLSERYRIPVAVDSDEDSDFAPDSGPEDKIV